MGADTTVAVPGATQDVRPQDAWERRWWAWEAIFYGLLAFAAVLTLLDGELARWRHLPALALTLAFAGWYWLLVGRAPHPRRSLRRVLIYFGGAVGLLIALIWLSPAYQFLYFGLFVQIYSFLPLRWSVPVAMSLTISIALRNLIADGFSDGAITIAILSLLGTGGGCLLAYWITTIIAQSRQRQELIDELAATRRELATAEREAGVMAERGRLAGEIHDTLAQGFVSIVTHLEAAEAALERGPSGDRAALRRHLDNARGAARENLADARRMVWALRPELLVGGTLPEAIERVARRWSAEHGVAATCTVTGVARRLSPEGEVALLRATQEALTNIGRHAGASAVAITLSFLDDVAILDVQDDGCGFDPALLDRPDGADLGGGFGLRGMRDRVAALGGTLTIESAPGEGTTLAIEVPGASAEC